MASITSYTKAEIDKQLGTKAATADLGTAALLDVGATTGTVMAGDDSRVTSLSSTYAALAPNPAPPRNLAITDYIYDQGTALDSGDSTGAWTVSGTGTLTDDTTYYRTGGHGLRMTITSGAFLQIDKVISINFGVQPSLSFWVYLHDTNVQSITVYITSAGLGVSYFLATIDPSALWYRTPGWNLVTIPPTYAWANTSGESWAATMTKIRIKVNAKTSTLPVVTVDDVRYNVRAEPKAIITFDDAHHTVYDTAFPIMRELGIPGVIYVNGSRVGTTGYMTAAQLTEVHRAGWDVANHGYAHISYAGLTQAAIETDMQDNIDWLEANGFTRAARHFAIPNSIYSAESRGAGDAVGLYTMRRAGNRNFIPAQVDLRSMPSRTVLNTTTLATLKAWFDAVHAEYSTAVFMFHQVATPATDTYDYPTADFAAFIRYLYDTVLEDSVVTMSRWWRGLNRAATQIAP